jgi:hypothetical protein
LTVWATYGGVRPHDRPYPIETWRAELVGLDGAILDATSVPAQHVPGALVRAPLTLTPPDDLPELTPALVYLTAQHNPAVVAATASVEVVLNRPGPAAIPDGATRLDAAFGPITLEAYIIAEAGESLTVTLYWQADTPPARDYQVFVHLLDARGEIVAQRDTTPVDGRYPTSQWRTGVPIADTHTLDLAGLPTGDYRLTVGLYTLPDAIRAGEPVTLTTITR